MNGKAIATICFQSVAQCICAGDLEQRDVVRLTLPEQRHRSGGQRDAVD